MATIDRTDPDQLATAQALVVQYLTEAHATEEALVTTLRAHIAMTPAGGYRELLERHLGETRQQARAIERRLEELDAGRGLIASGIDLAQTFVGQVLALTKGPVDLLRGKSGEEKLLKNAKDECATEALEIATYDALHALADAVGDEKTAKLALRHRGQEERMLEELRALIPALTHATVLAQAKGDPTYDPSTTGAADAARRFARNAEGKVGTA
jgi:ferritin-like metal-binding protein YciE